MTRGKIVLKSGVFCQYIYWLGGRLGVLSPALYQTSRGQRIKRERLGTRLSKNNFRSGEVFTWPQNLSIDFVPDLTPYLGFSIKCFVKCEPDSERISYIYPKQPRWKLIHGSLHSGNCPLFWLLPHYCYSSLVIPFNNFTENFTNSTWTKWPLIRKERCRSVVRKIVMNLLLLDVIFRFIDFHKKAW